MSNKLNLRQGILKMTLSLYNNPHIPRDAVQDVINMIENFIAELYIPYLQHEIALELEEIENKRILSSIKILLDENKYPIQDFSTEHKRFKMYEKHSSFIQSQSYKIAEDIEFIGNTINKITPVYATIIPTRNILENILKIPGLFQDILQYVRSLENEKLIISNIMQGQLWRRKYQHFSETIVLPIFIYYDDFEPGNAMGSHAGQQELGGLYLSLPFLPPHLVAKLTNIFVISLCYTKHRKKLGYRLIFKKVVEELNELSTKGINVDIDGQQRTIYFRCVLVLGDNLGLNGALGFVENFNAIRYCRICRATCDECRIMVGEEPSLLRTKENYDEDLKQNCISTGIKEPSIFNDLIDYHVIDNKSIDLMHDVCEGVIYYTLSKILTCLIEKDKLFTLDVLNQRIQNFDYGSVESSNKPRIINKEASKKVKGDIIKNKIKLKQSAAEMLCLCRYLSVIIGDLVPENNKYWKLYLILRKIIAITTAPRFISADVAELRLLINKHNKLYLEFFGLLKPKMHFMVHMPQIMLDNGPLVHFWCMLNERKNKEVKEFATNTQSHRNLPLSVSIRCQLQLCFRKEYYQNLSNILLGNVVNNSDMEIQNFFPSIQHAPTYKYVQIYGKKLCDESIIVTNTTDDGPVFGKIKKIYCISNSIYLLVKKMTVIYFKDHYYAYKINEEQETTIFDVNSLPKVEPCILIQKSTDSYVITRYNV